MTSLLLGAAAYAGSHALCERWGKAKAATWCACWFAGYCAAILWRTL